MVQKNVYFCKKYLTLVFINSFYGWRKKVKITTWFLNQFIAQIIRCLIFIRSLSER